MEPVNEQPTKKRSVIHTIREELITVVIFVGVIWGVFFADLFLPLQERFPLVPRTLGGIVGIFTMPFLHGDFWHLWSNTIPLLVLMLLLAGSRANSWETVIFISLIGGALLWLFGSPADFFMSLLGSEKQAVRHAHIGASLLIFGLITFLISSGFFEKRPVPMVIAMIVAFMYGLTFIIGIIPKPASRVSWDGHLSGGVAGVAVAYWLTRKPKPVPAAVSPPLD